jgi:hypothetical protein
VGWVEVADALTKHLCGTCVPQAPKHGPAAVRIGENLVLPKANHFQARDALQVGRDRTDAGKQENAMTAHGQRAHWTMRSGLRHPQHKRNHLRR